MIKIKTHEDIIYYYAGTMYSKKYDILERLAYILEEGEGPENVALAMRLMERIGEEIKDGD